MAPRAGGKPLPGAVNAARFSHFLAIDWSGAKGTSHKGLALGLCSLDGSAPRLIAPPRRGRWSREEVCAYLASSLPADTLVGLDLGISLPFADAGAFFPGLPDSPRTARGLWAMIDEICARDADLAATSFVDHPQLSAYFRRHGGREGTHFHLPGSADRRGRMRVTEAAQERMKCKPYSNFNLVGAAQVGKSSLTGMRMLHRLTGILPVWPIDALPAHGSTIVEIYTSIAAIAAGRSASRTKMTDIAALNAALGQLGSPGIPGTGTIDDHSSDALLTSAWLRCTASRPDLWHPPELTTQLAMTEGWTFGAA